MNYYLSITDEMGRGLYASHNLAQETLLFEAELLVLSESDTLKVEQTDLKYYTFKYTETQDCLVLGDGEIFNHDDAPNVAYRLVQYPGRMVMQFITIKPIKAHEQLFIDYTADVKVNASEYVGKNLL